MKVIVPEGENINSAMWRHYTGVGSRRTPPKILKLMTLIANGPSASYVLRSGGAEGADQAFEMGADKALIFYADDATIEAMYLASQYHPAWHRCSPFAKKLHGRNAMQVLGAQLTKPSKFLFCWTPDGATTHNERSIETGGTGTAISIASAYGVPVYNLQRPHHLKKVEDWLYNRT